MEGRARRAYRRTSVRRLRETTGQTTVEWLAVMVGVGALVVALVAAMPATASAIVESFDCLVRSVAGGGDCDATSGSGDTATLPTFGDGPPILHVGDGSDWVPQGLGYDPSTDQLLTTYYSSPDGNPDRDAGILLSIQDGASGNEVLSALLAGPDHGGGVAIDGDHVWVTSSDGYVYLYSMADIKAANGATVQPQTRFAVPASAYLTVHGGRLYVGSFDEQDPGSVYSVPLGADGQPSGPPVFEATAPPRSQGLAVTDDGFVFSTSWGRKNPSELISISHSGEVKHLTAPNMSEGLVIVNGQVYVVYESGASAYQYDGNHPSNHITITPLDAIK
jgi:hypothetical protein